MNTTTNNTNNKVMNKNYVTEYDVLRALNENKDEKGKQKEALIKLGLDYSFVEELLREFYADSSSIFKYTFGVEMECSYLRINEVRSDSIRFRNESLRSQYNHRDSREAFRFVYDGSLNGEAPTECVTPVLSGDDLNPLHECCRAINEAGARVNKSCGLHIHVGVEDMTDTWYVNVFKNYQRLEAIIDTFMANSRRGNNSQWCRSLSRYNFDNCYSIIDVNYVIGTRYVKVNPQAWNRHRTIEFRQHQGSTDYKKISMWLAFVSKLVEYSRESLIEGVTTISEIPFLNDEEKAFFEGRANTLR